jgi:hypothetical protein
MSDGVIKILSLTFGSGSYILANLKLWQFVSSWADNTVCSSAVRFRQEGFYVKRHYWLI